MFGALKKIFTPRPKANEWERRYAMFKRHLASLPADDLFWPTLMDLLDKFKDEEIDKLCAAGISSEEVQRARGRVGMLLDLRNDLASLPDKARAEIEAAAKKA